MTNPIELTPPGRDVSQAEQDRWFKGIDLGRPGSDLTVEAEWHDGKWVNARVRHPNGFDPMAPISDLAGRLLRASNAFYDFPVDGPRVSEPGTTRHARFAFHWGK